MILKYDPNPVNGLILRIFILIDQARFEDAHKILNNIMDVDPDEE